MKNVLFADLGARMRRINLKSRIVYLGGEGSNFLLLLILCCWTPKVVFGQQGGPGTAWNSGVNFHSNSGCQEDSWSFNAVEMDNGDLVVVGYTTTTSATPPDCRNPHEYPDNHTWVRVPAYAVLDKNGTLRSSGYYQQSDEAGGFNQIAKDPNPNGGVAMAGWQGSKALITKLKPDYSEDWKFWFDIPGDPGSERIYGLQVFPNGDVLVSGGNKDGTQGDVFFATIGLDSGVRKVLNFSRLPELDGKILDFKIVDINGTSYVLATGFRARNQSTTYTISGTASALNASNLSLSGHSYAVEDYDVMVGIFPLSRIGNTQNPLTAADFKYYTSGTFDPPGYSDPDPFPTGSPLIPSLAWAADPCPDQYGPCTPGKSSKWASPNASPVVDNYFGHISKDIGRNIVYSNGFIYVSAEMRTFEMTGDIYKDLHTKNKQAVNLSGFSCPDGGENFRNYDAYKDAYIHLLKFDLNGNLVQSKNVTHCSGGDFYGAITVDRNDGKIVLATNTSDQNICGLPAIDLCNKGSVNLLIKVDPSDLHTIWQQHQILYGEANCVFGILQTADGGFLAIGNNEYEDASSTDQETFNIVRYNSDCLQNTPFDLGNYTLPTGLTTTWSLANKRINGLITVPNGATLIIDGITVEFAYTKYLPPNRKCGIVVQPGGRLIVKGGAVLKGLNACGSEQMWDGILALGNPQSPQLNANQAFVEILGNSRIENALRGTVLGNAAWSTEFVETPVGASTGTQHFWNYFETYTQGGGKLTATNATFSNCGKGVVWNPYFKFSNLSVLTDTRFECSGALVDPNYMPFHTALGEPTSTETFCEIQSNRGIRFVNCLNLNTAPGPLFVHPRNKPSGILSMDGQFKVDGSSTQFQNLYVGIQAAGIASGIPSAVSVNGAHFNNCYQGTNLVGTMGTEIAGCSYSGIPNTTSPADGDAAGIFCSKATAYTLRSNTLSGGANNYGIVSRHSALNGALIEGNTFNNFNLLADLFDNDNSNLQTHCNTYQGAVGDVSWDVKGAMKDQLSQFNPNYYPDNRFLWECGVGGLLDIRSTTPFSYYERTESAANTASILKCFTPTVTKVPGNSTSAPNCIIEDPCPNPPYCNGLLNTYNESNYALPYRNDLLNAYVRMSSTVVIDSLYLPATTRAISLLSSRNQQADKRILTAIYASTGDYTNAQQYLQQVTGTDTETQDFLTYYSVLLNAGLAGRDSYHLTAWEFVQLSPLMAHTSAVSDQVKVLDHVLNGVYHPLNVASSTGGRPGDERTEGVPFGNNENSLLVMPNPFSREVQFVAPNGIFLTEVTIVDISGRLLFEVNHLKASTFAWQSGEAPDGMLFYLCRLSNGEIARGKLLHKKNP